ncbi:MAG: hypothetical protein JW751_08955 [Polyangiaceae bacterium]|nr:hypothetical protein [Polyangiaceae bacterium]
MNPRIALPYLAIAFSFTHIVLPAWAEEAPEDDDGWTEPAKTDGSPVSGDAAGRKENEPRSGDASEAERSSDSTQAEPTPKGNSAPAGGTVVVLGGSSATADAATGTVIVLGEDTDQEEDAEEEENGEGDEPRARPAPSLLGRSGPIAFGGYAGVDLRYARIGGEDGLLVGGEAALLLDHRFAIGGAGYGLANLIRGPETEYGEHTYVGFGYGGVLLKSNFVWESPVYFSVGLLVGAGGLGFAVQTEDFEFEPMEEGGSATAFFVIEPSFGVYANLTRWLRLGVNASYRATRGIEVEGYRDGDFSGLSAGGQLAFGWF